jgi:hypothetical protein
VFDANTSIHCETLRGAHKFVDFERHKSKSRPRPPPPLPLVFVIPLVALSPQASTALQSIKLTFAGRY